MPVQAEGHGIALARSIMAREDLPSGRLIRLFPEISFPSPPAYSSISRSRYGATAGLAKGRLGPITAVYN